MELPPHTRGGSPQPVMAPAPVLRSELASAWTGGANNNKIPIIIANVDVRTILGIVGCISYKKDTFLKVAVANQNVNYSDTN